MFSHPLGFMAFVFTVIAVLFGGTWVLANVVNLFQCQSASLRMNKPTDFGWLTGCFVKVQGEWVPIKQYRVID